MLVFALNFFPPLSVFLYSFFFGGGGREDESNKNSQQPSNPCGGKVREKSCTRDEVRLVKQPRSRLLRGGEGGAAGQRGEQQADPDRAHSPSDVHAFWTLMSFTVCVEKCQKLIRMLNEVVNCSLCIFLYSHGSSDLDSFSLYFTSLFSPSLLPHCM